MSYSQEFRCHWRAVAAASIGLAVGYTFTNYVTTIIAPHLMVEFSWSKSDFALLGLIVVIAIFCQPIAGRVVDGIGVRRMAMIGVISAPILFLVLSQMSGEFWLFYVINLVQVILVGGTTSVVIYTRLIAERFDLARGAALGIAAAAPAVLGLACAPILNAFVDSYGWRNGYIAVAAFTALAGFAAILLIPKNASAAEASRGVTGAKVDYRKIVRNSAFPLLMTGVLLCNLTLTLQMSQIKVLLLDRGVSSAIGSLMVSLYAGGVIAGRLVCGVALDRYPPHLIAAVAMAAPALGLFVLASGFSSLALIAMAVAILGLSMGAEGDVGSYLVMKYFEPEVYSSTFGLLMGTLSLSGAIGALILSYTLKISGSFSLFLIISGIAALVGGSMFLLLGRRQRAVDALLASR